MNRPVRPSSPSRTLPLSTALLGSRLAQPVLDPQGNALLAAGATLTDDVVRSLLRRDVETVCVLEEPSVEHRDGTDRAAELEAERDRIKRQIEHLFRHSQRPDQINPLLHLVLRYRLEKLS